MVLYLGWAKPIPQRIKKVCLGEGGWMSAFWPGTDPLANRKDPSQFAHRQTTEIPAVFYLMHPGFGPPSTWLVVNLFDFQMLASQLAFSSSASNP